MHMFGYEQLGTATLKKYLFKLPSASLAESLAVFVQADIPLLCAETSFEP